MPSLFEIGQPVPEKKIFEGFLPYMGMAASWSCDLDFLYIHWFPLHIDASYKIWLSLAKRFQRRRCLNIMVIYMCYAPGWGQMSPWGPLFRIINIQS